MNGEGGEGKNGIEGWTPERFGNGEMEKMGKEMKGNKRKIGLIAL